MQVKTVAAHIVSGLLLALVVISLFALCVHAMLWGVAGLRAIW